MERFFIDRIEDGRCFLEAEGGGFSVTLSYVPAGSSEGSCLIMTENGFTPDDKYTKKRRSEIAALKNRLSGKE